MERVKTCPAWRQQDAAYLLQVMEETGTKIYRLSDEERGAVRGLHVFERRCDVVAVTADILARVGRSFPVEPIRTLDAIHLATAEVLGEPPPLVTIVTRDARVRDNARALGYVVE